MYGTVCPLFLIVSPSRTEILLGTNYYGPSIDLWSIGCIFAEMSNKKALFSGDSEIDQLYRIFRTLGTPGEDIWPDVNKLQDYKPNFPKWQRQNLKKILVNLDDNAIDLLEVILILSFTLSSMFFCFRNCSYMIPINEFPRPRLSAIPSLVMFPSAYHLITRTLSKTAKNFLRIYLLQLFKSTINEN